MYGAGLLREADKVSSSKYALVERERRFLVSQLPQVEPWATRSITDLYVEGTQIRLRKSDGVVDGRPETVRKLTQKVPARTKVVGHCGFITTMYLNQDEYEVFARLPGFWLNKQRFSFPPIGVDVFDGGLAGLAIAEAEFLDDETMTRFVPPPFCGPEITERPALTGASLARMAALPVTEAAQALAVALSAINR